MIQFNAFTLHDLVGFIVMGASSIAMYFVYWRFGRRLADLLLANLLLCSALYCLTPFLSDNIIPQGTPSLAVDHAGIYTLWSTRAAFLAGMLSMPMVLHFAFVYSCSTNRLSRNTRWVYVATILLCPLVVIDGFLCERQVPTATTSSWSNSVPWYPEQGGCIGP